MPTPKYMLLVAKSRAACLSAVESYNRASSLYREETFAILMINAWELLLKARVMREHGGKASALHEYRQRRKKDGTPSKLREVKETRSGAPMTTASTVAGIWCQITRRTALKRPGFSGGSFHWVMQPYRGYRGLHSNCLRPQRAGCAR